MAKRNRSTLNTTAKNIGTALGHVAAKVESLRRQRLAVATEIRQVLEAAQEMLAELGDEAVVAKRRIGRRANKAIKSVRRKRMISVEGRARIAAAQRRRWAKYKKAKKEAA
jgi:ElaB/YqjD/DUF883 family membrane-anchored ribosome-binding protein